MDKDSKTSEVNVERRKRKSTSRKDENGKKSRGKQRKKDISSENVDSNQSTENKKSSESPSTSRPPSPDPNCSICLGDLQNKSFTDSCFHMFCFVCLKEWSKVKAECPLCKQKFKNIIYNVRSYEKYDRYNIEEEASRNTFEHDGARFRYRTTLTFERRLTIGPEHNYTQPIARPTNMTTRSHWRRQRQAATSDFRRRVYRNGMRAQEVRDRRLRTREVTPDFFKRNTAQTHRLVPWLNRELNALLQNQSEQVQLVMEIIMGLIKSFPIDSEEFYQHVVPYVGRNTRHFMHEFLNFARSPYSMAGYDSHVTYTAGAFNVDTDSNDSVSEFEDDDFDGEIIDIEEEREPAVQRGRNRLLDSMTDLRPLFDSVRDILETETPGSSTNYPLSMSGWDSPTPGPSWTSLSGIRDPPSPVIPHGFGSSIVPPVVGNRESSPIDIGSSSGTDSDSTVSADSDGSAVVFVKMDKAWEERSPIMLSSADTDDEVKRSIDFVKKHYSKKKSHLKKKDTKKHKEHKKHKDDSRRERSKERHKHKKHKKRHSSDKSHKRSSSKRRDSDRSSSSPKHGEHSRSTSQTSNVDHSRSSGSSERHHSKKHKKHRHGDKKKSRHINKLPSVIVVPNNSIADSDITSQPNSSGHLFSAGLSTYTTSATNMHDSSQAVESRFKKHSTGHKKSSKLVDIVPKLLEKGLDKLNTKSGKSESTLETDKSDTCTTSSCSGSPLFSQPSHKFVPSQVSNSSAREIADSNLVNSTMTMRPSESYVPFSIPEDILSLENSRRCLKCGLLYIPELLDYFDVCVTCKKKKVCETESRNFSDVFSQLATNQSTSNQPSLPENNRDLNTVTNNMQNHAENIVIQEGNETTLRPVLNHVDLTSVDALIESDNDDCELILANTVIDLACIGNEHKTSMDLTIDNDKSPVQVATREKSPLSLNLSSPPTPMSVDQSRISLLSARSPLPWPLDISNPQTPSLNDWPGFMSLNLPNYPPALPGLLNNRLDGYPTSYLTSSFSPMSCSSVNIFADSFGSKYSMSKPLLIDLENDVVDLEKDDCQSKTGTTNMSVCSPENICLSDSDDSEKSLKITDTEKVSTENYNIGNLNIINETCEHECMNKDRDIDDTNIENQSEMDTAEEENISTASDDLDTEMTLKCTSNKDTAKTSENHDNQNNSIKDIEVESSAVDTSSSIEKHEPKSFAEKLNGLTDFSPSVLKRLDSGKGLSFHHIISNKIQCVPAEIENSDGDQSSNEYVGQTLENFDGNLLGKIKNDSIIRDSNFQQKDALVGNFSKDSDNKIEDETLISGCATMNSVELEDNDFSVFNSNNESRNLGSSADMDTESSRNFDLISELVESPHEESLPLPDTDTERSTVISTVSEWITNNSQNTNEQNQSILTIDYNLDLQDRLGTSIENTSTINNDHLDASDNCNDSCLTEFDSSDSDLLVNGLSEESDGSESNIESFRVDILHTEKDLSNNFSRIFESSDSN